MAGPLKLTIVLGVVALLSLGGTPARAAAERPESGRYAAECCGGEIFGGYALVAQLRVEPGGRSLRAASGGRGGTYVGCDQDGTLRALRPRRAVAIRADGSFAFGGTRHGSRFRVRGRFDGTDTAWVRLRVGARPSRFGCPSGPRTLRLHRAAGHAPFTGCLAQPGRTTIESDSARVFYAERVYPRTWARLSFAYACLKGGGPRVLLGWSGYSEGGLGQLLGPFRLAGPYVAFGCGGMLTGGCGGSVRVIDLRDGSELRRARMASGPGGQSVGPSGVELLPSGAVAWLEGGYYGGRGRVAVQDAGGTRVLDEGLGIEADSLSSNGTTLSWRRDGELRTAPFG